jgi:hypothetical protein
MKIAAMVGIKGLFKKMSLNMAYLQFLRLVELGAFIAELKKVSFTSLYIYLLFEAFDISADLIELGKTPVAVVCAGAKSILDIPKTLEFLVSNINLIKFHFILGNIWNECNCLQ